MSLKHLANIDLEELLNLIERSLVCPSAIEVLEQSQLTEEKMEHYYHNEDYQKYFISDYEPLSAAIIQLFESGRGGYIVNYAHQFNRNPYQAGFETEDDLIHYADFALAQGIEALQHLKEEVLQLKESEDQLTLEEIVRLNLEHFKTKEKILENLFNFEAKKVYCDKLTTLKTVQTSFENLFETFQLMYPIAHCLDELN